MSGMLEKVEKPRRMMDDYKTPPPKKTYKRI